jgi:hypothetical protein
LLGGWLECRNRLFAAGKWLPAADRANGNNRAAGRAL